MEWFVRSLALKPQRLLCQHASAVAALLHGANGIFIIAQEISNVKSFNTANIVLFAPDKKGTIPVDFTDKFNRYEKVGSLSHYQQNRLKNFIFKFSQKTKKKPKQGFFKKSKLTYFNTSIKETTFFSVEAILLYVIFT